MATFDMNIRKKNRSIARITSGVLSCTLDNLRNENEDVVKIRLGGFDSNKKQNIDWYINTLQVGDELQIKIREHDYNIGLSQPINIRNEEQIEDIVLESKLKSYKKLKQELEGYGLI